jgi:hypothetical protein
MLRKLLHSARYFCHLFRKTGALVIYDTCTHQLFYDELNNSEIVETGLDGIAWTAFKSGFVFTGG